jgi:hypothetical protein
MVMKRLALGALALLLAIAGIARAGGPIDPEGKPADMPSEHYALWHDGAGWHLRTTTKTKEQHFRGEILVTGPGAFGALRTENPQRFVEGVGRRRIAFDFAAAKGMTDGLDFTVTGENAVLKFTLEIGEKDPKFEPELIFIGKEGAHPAKRSFEIAAHGRKGDEREVARERAEAGWEALVKNFAVPSKPGHYRGELGKVRPAMIWPQAETLHAALYLAPVAHEMDKFEKIAREAAEAVAEYKLVRNGTTGYAPTPHPPKNASRFRDDNGVLGLAFLQAAYQSKNPKHYLDLVAEIFPFYESGQKKAEGGVYWQDDDPRPARGLSATGTDDEVALRLFMAYGTSERHSYRAFVELNAQWLDKALLVKEGPMKGLYYNSFYDDAGKNPTKTGHVCEWMFTYNQGFVIGTDVLFYRITNEKKYLEHAGALARASLDYWTPEKLWKEPAPFTAYFFRNLLVLNHYAPDPRYRKVLAAYLDRVWNEARNRETGLFTAGGVGLYGKEGEKVSLLNQAMFVQMFALFAWPDERLPDAT